MEADNLWKEQDAKARPVYSQAEIDVFKPKRIEALIESANQAPGFPADKKKSASGLLDRLQSIPGRSRIPIVSVYGVPGKGAVDAEVLEK